MQTNPEYKQILQLLQHAEQLSQFSIPFAYITKAYTAQKLHALYKKTQAQELMQQLQQLISELGIIKNNNPQLTDKEEMKKLYLEFVMKFFFEIDTRERDGEVSQELLQMFGQIQKCIEVIQYFEPLSQDFQEKQKYAKFKMVEQHKKIKDPSLIKPKAKDPIDEELEQIAQQQQKQQQQNQNQNQNQFSQQQQQNPSVQQQINKQSQYQQPQQQQFQPPQQPSIKQTQPQQPTYQPTTQQPPQQQLPYQPPQQQLPQQPSQQIPQQPPQQLSYQPPPQQPTQPQQQKPLQKLTPMEQAQARNQIKTVLQSTISEVDFKKYQNAKIQLTKALEMLQQIIDSQ